MIHHYEVQWDNAYILATKILCVGTFCVSKVSKAVTLSPVGFEFSYILNFVPSTHNRFKQSLSLYYHLGLLIDMAEELDMKGLFYKLANAEQEGEDAVMDRKKITRALKVEP